MISWRNRYGWFVLLVAGRHIHPRRHQELLFRGCQPYYVYFVGELWSGHHTCLGRVVDTLHGLIGVGLWICRDLQEQKINYSNPPQDERLSASQTSTCAPLRVPQQRAPVVGLEIVRCLAFPALQLTLALQMQQYHLHCACFAAA
jgi:hypothetical protein